MIKCKNCGHDLFDHEDESPVDLTGKGVQLSFKPGKCTKCTCKKFVPEKAQEEGKETF